MTTLLEVYWNDHLTGRLWLEDDNMQFEYDEGWLNKPSALPLSKRLPLQREPLPSDAVKIFFCNLLPEEELKKRLSKKYGISEDNYFGLLEKIGGECAGALSILPKHLSTSQNSFYEELSNEQIDNMIDGGADTPFIMGHSNTRMSLAGTQEKLPVFFKNRKLYLPVGKNSSSHILKPPSTLWKSTVINELFCMILAKRVGLNVPEVNIYNTGKHLCYLIERYDRKMEQDHLKRIHQEDFCQALGLMPSQKYQKDGGYVSLKKCFHFIIENSSYPQNDITALIKWVVYNLIIGNCDAHAKNLSMLINENGYYQLAPFYDILSTVVYPELSRELAMKIGNEYSLNNIQKSHWEKLVQDIQIPILFFKEISIELCSSIHKNISGLTQEIQDKWGDKKIIDEIKNRVVQKSSAILLWN